MVSALGIRIPLIYAGVFALGVGIAGFSAGVFLPLMPMALVQLQVLQVIRQQVLISMLRQSLTTAVMPLLLV